MDAREQLRRYLEQRREMGETELLLDGLGVDDALRLLGVRESHGETRTRAAADSPRPVSPVAEERPRRSRPASGGDADWRETLRAAGASPELRAGDASSNELRAGMSDSPNENATPFDNVPRTKQPLPPLPVQPQASPTPSASSHDGADLVSPSALSLVSASTGDSLAKIASEVAICTRCPLYQTATNPVPGEGNSHADLMCVGEAPGATEDETGRPFVGAAGQLLTKILEAIRLPRDQVFICNVLKHRPPGNRNPLPEEVTACSPFLIRQIELVRPKVILALGSFAAQALLQSKLSLGRLRGQIHQYHGVPVVVTYHPAALLRNPSWKRPTWEDVQLARRILDSADQSGA